MQTPTPRLHTNPFYRPAQTFALALRSANIGPNDNVPGQIYMNLMADLLTVLPNLLELVLPKEWDQKFNVEKFHELGSVTWC